VAAVEDELVGLLERAGIEKLGEALAGGELAGGVLLLDALWTASRLGLLEPPAQLGERAASGRLLCGAGTADSCWA
jgi:hypothetical protein